MIKIRQINEKYTDIIHQLNAEIFGEDITYDRDYIKQYCDAKRGFVAVDSNTNNGIGYILFGTTYTMELNKNVFTIISIGVKKEYRKKGIARKLIKLVHHLYSDRDIYLHVKVNNKNAQCLYISEGYKIIKLMNNYYTDLVGDNQHAYTMERKSLKSSLSEK